MSPASSDVSLSLAHAAQIEAIRHRYQHCSSSHAFDTLYIWRRFVGEQLHLEADMFTLRYKAKGPNTWLFPCGSRHAAARFIADHLSEPDFSLCYLLKQDIDWLQDSFPDQFTLYSAVGDSEYVISRAAHLALSGKTYEKLRNKVNRAERDHQIEITRLSSENISEALQIIQSWRGNRKVNGTLDLYGDEEDTEPLTEREQLGITGILMRVDGMPFGVAAGYMLDDTTYDIFLSKECAKDPALGYYMRRELLRTLPDTVQWINLEDDLEIEGLRTMKKQMIPEKMNEMWTAVHT